MQEPNSSLGEAWAARIAKLSRRAGGIQGERNLSLEKTCLRESKTSSRLKDLRTNQHADAFRNELNSWKEPGSRGQSLLGNRLSRNAQERERFNHEVSLYGKPREFHYWRAWRLVEGSPIWTGGKPGETRREKLLVSSMTRRAIRESCLLWLRLYHASGGLWS